MFIPLGGIFVFGGCDSRACRINRIVMGIINLIMGSISIGFGIGYNVVFLTVIGSIIGGLGVLMILLNLFGLRKAPREASTTTYDMPHKTFQQ